MNRVILLLVVGVSVLGAACGKSSPAAPAKTVSSLSISPGTDWVKIKGTEKFSVTALYTSGATEAVTPTWSSDNSGIASVDASGTATGVAAGQATLAASYQGSTATRGLRVIPDYAGHWSGNWKVTSCSVEGGFPANWCGPVNNAVYPATLDILQTKDVVSATWMLQEDTGTAQGSIAADGKLSLTGSSLQSGVTIEITAWQSVTTDNKTMTGAFTLKWTAAGRSGSAQTVVELSSFNKQ